MITIRTARPSDVDVLGRLGGALMRQHHAEDAHRFLQVENPEAGYGRYLVSQIDGRDAQVLVAECDGVAVGYAYATVEGTNWMQLRGPSGVVQDVYVDAPARRKGAGRALLQAAIDWIHMRGRTQVVLMTKTRNEHAQRLFASFGFRPTMLEMTLDLTGRGGHA